MAEYQCRTVHLGKDISCILLIEGANVVLALVVLDIHERADISCHILTGNALNGIQEPLDVAVEAIHTIDGQSELILNLGQFVEGKVSARVFNIGVKLLLIELLIDTFVLVVVLLC